jgi:multicomponent Na+:H+ antiporter subunit D
LSGFIAKLAVVAPMIDARQYVLAAVSLSVSLLTVVSMARVWEEGFWKPAQATAAVTQPRLGVVILAPIMFLVSLTIGLTALAGPVSGLTLGAGEQLLNPERYIRAVLGQEAQRAAR